MIHRPSARIRVYRLIAVAAACTLAGCDLGTYEARRNEARTNVGKAWQAKKHLGQAVSISTADKKPTGVSISFPKAFGENMKMEAVPPTYPISKALIGFAEAPDNTGGGPLALFGSLPATTPLEDVVTAINAVAAVAAPGVAAQRTDGEVFNAADGSTSPPITHLSYVGVQAALKVVADQPPQGGPGRTDVYIVSTPKDHVIFIFRASDEAAAKHDFASALNDSMASIKVDPAIAAAPAAAPADGANPMPMPPAN